MDRIYTFMQYAHATLSRISLLPAAVVHDGRWDLQYLVICTKFDALIIIQHWKKK